MAFDSFSEFLNMGGHALYVWLAYGVGILVLLVATFSSLSAPSKAKREIMKLAQREQAFAANESGANAPVGPQATVQSDNEVRT